MKMNKLKDIVRIDHDIRNLIGKCRKPEPREVVAYALFFLGICLAVAISIPLLIGAFNIIWEGKEIPSSSASIQLAFVSTALGGVVLWYVTNLSAGRNSRRSGKSESEKRFSASQRRGALMVGTMLLFAAMCFTLFALLSPLFPQAKDAKDAWFVIIKYVSVFSLMAGSMALSFSLCVGIFDIWSWSLAND